MKKRLFLGGCLALGLLVLSSRVSALVNDNLLTNGPFDSDLSGWTVFSDVVWASNDANGSVSSGSAFVTDTHTDGSLPGINQCVLLPGSGPFDVGGRFFFPSGQGQQPFGEVVVFWYSTTTCGVGGLRGDIFKTPLPTPTDSWTSAGSLVLTPPAGAVAAAVIFGIGKAGSQTGPTVVGYVDGAFFRLTSCTTADEVLCTHGGRFRVTAEWESPIDGGHGHGVQFNDDSGWFWFLSSNNTEVVFKTVSACVDPFNRYWVFAAGLTNFLVTLNVEDTVAGVARHYINPQGQVFVTIPDTNAFDTCP